MEYIEKILNEFRNKNPDTFISNTSTQDPNTNDGYLSNEGTCPGCNSFDTLNSNIINERDISENSIHCSASNKITVALSDTDEDSNENEISNSNQSISNEIPDECVDIDEFIQLDVESNLDIHIITKTSTADGKACRLANIIESLIENKTVADLEVANNMSCIGNCIEVTNNISLAAANETFEGIGNEQFSSVDVDDVKKFTTQFKQETITEIKNECPLIYSENKEVVNNFDSISISSSEDCTPIKEAKKVIQNKMHQNSGDLFKDDINWDSDCSGYHSSDFEFITESEAKLEGLITKCKNGQEIPLINNNIEPGPSYSKSHVVSYRRKDDAIPSESNKDNDLSNRTHVGNPRYLNDLNINRPNTSSLSMPNSSNFRNDFLRDRYRPGPSAPNNIALVNHPLHIAIPHGEQYFDLFRGIYAPDMPLSAIYMMENKSIRTTSMNVEFEGIGFDMRLMRNFEDSSQEEYEDEAQESVEKILNLYPGDNRKRRRRH